MELGQSIKILNIFTCGEGSRRPSFISPYLHLYFLRCFCCCFSQFLFWQPTLRYQIWHQGQRRFWGLAAPEPKDCFVVVAYMRSVEFSLVNGTLYHMICCQSLGMESRLTLSTGKYSRRYSTEIAFMLWQKLYFTRGCVLSPQVRQWWLKQLRDSRPNNNTKAYCYWDFIRSQVGHRLINY